MWSIVPMQTANFKRFVYMIFLKNVFIHSHWIGLFQHIFFVVTLNLMNSFRWQTTNVSLARANWANVCNVFFIFYLYDYLCCWFRFQIDFSLKMKAWINSLSVDFSVDLTIHKRFSPNDDCIFIRWMDFLCDW